MCLASGSIWRRSDRPKNHRQLLDPVSSALVQPVESSGLEASQHFSIFPLSLTVASWVGNGGETDFAAEVLGILHEGAACELCAIVDDDPVGYTKAAH